MTLEPVPYTEDFSGGEGKKTKKKKRALEDGLRGAHARKLPGTPSTAGGEDLTLAQRWE